MSKPSIDVLLDNEVTVISGGPGVGKTNLLLEAAAENSNRGKTSLVVLRSMPANTFYDKMMKLRDTYDVSGVAVVKIKDFDGDFSNLTKDANTFDRVFFEGIHSKEELASVPTFVGSFTFETYADILEDWADFLGVFVADSGEEVLDNGR